MKTDSPKVRHTVRRIRYRPSGIEAYRIQEYMGHLFNGVQTVPDLRGRFRQFVDDDTVWEAISAVRETFLDEQQALQKLEKAIKKAAR